MPASRKLQAEDAAALLADAARLHVAKGRKVRSFPGGSADPEAVSAMLGPTGNLRAPTLVVGDTLIVGFDETLYETVFG